MRPKCPIFKHWRFFLIFDIFWDSQWKLDFFSRTEIFHGKARNVEIVFQQKREKRRNCLPNDKISKKMFLWVISPKIRFEIFANQPVRMLSMRKKYIRRPFNWNNIEHIFEHTLINIILEDQWTKIYNQIGPVPSFDGCTLGSCDITVDEDNFMRFNLLQDTGPYDFKIRWELNGEVQWVQWTQEINPLAATSQERVVSG